jgi:hypothetical protein
LEEVEMNREPLRRRQLKSDVRTLLSSLGDSPAQIAARLEAFGVRATARDPRGCAIAVFLNAVLAAEPAVRSIKVTNKRVVVETTGRWSRDARVKLSGALRRFVSAFDESLFPALVRVEAQGSPPMAAHDGSSGP